MFSTTIVGRDTSDVIAKLNQDIDRARATRLLIEGMTPTANPTTVSVRYASNGGFSMEVRPITKERKLHTKMMETYDALMRFLRGTCSMCDRPRLRGRGYCSEECHTAWRVREAEKSGYMLYD
jgi:hypothetical protein